MDNGALYTLSSFKRDIGGKDAATYGSAFAIQYAPPLFPVGYTIFGGSTPRVPQRPSQVF